MRLYNTSAPPKQAHRGFRALLFVLLLSLVHVLGSCDAVGDSPFEVEVRPGTIIFFGDTSQVSLSGIDVGVGAPLTIQVPTFGSGSCVRAAGMEVAVDGLVATVVPLDTIFIQGPEGACTADLRLYEHTGVVLFTEPGEATIRIRGAGRGPGFEEPEGVAILERKVRVE